eukprot:jgi/Mesvir1/20892/Mv07966-RA.3
MASLRIGLPGNHACLFSVPSTGFYSLHRAARDAPGTQAASRKGDAFQNVIFFRRASPKAAAEFWGVRVRSPGCRSHHVQSTCRKKTLVKCGRRDDDLSFGDDVEYDIDDVRSRVAEAIGLAALDADIEVVVQGKAKQAGLDMTWSFRWTPDGTFHESLSGYPLSCARGYSPSTDHVGPWEVDQTGYPKVLELDDRETVLLEAWVRSGFWLHPTSQRLLHARVVAGPDPRFPDAPEPEHLATASAAADTWDSLAGQVGRFDRDKGAAAQPKCGYRKKSWKEQRREEARRDYAHVAGAGSQNPGMAILRVSPPSSPASAHRTEEDTLAAFYGSGDANSMEGQSWEGLMRTSAEGLGCTAFGGDEEWSAQDNGVAQKQVFVHLQAVGGLVAGVLTIDTTRWLPTHFRVAAYGAEQCLEFDNWACNLLDQTGGTCHIQQDGVVPPGSLLFPSVFRHTLSNGGLDEYYTAYVAASPEHSTVLPVAMPLVPASIRNTHFSSDEYCPPIIQAMCTRIGHVLVRPLVDGVDHGYFVLDSGASGMVICPSLIHSRFRVGSSFTLGPLTITQPLYMEMELEGLIKEVSPIVGICGYDIFLRAVVEMIPVNDTSTNIILHEPSRFEPHPHMNWQEVHTVSDVPYVRAKFHRQAEGLNAGARLPPGLGTGHQEEDEELFLLDTGAGGVDVILHGKAVKRLGLLSPSATSTSLLKGLGNGGSGLTVSQGKLAWLHLCGETFAGPTALFGLEDANGLNLSEYTAGLLCGNLVRKKHIVFDLPHKRVGIMGGPRRGYHDQDSRQAVVTTPFHQKHL